MNSSYDLSLEEQKIILTLASMVQPTDEEFKPYKFKINEFMALLGVNTKTKYSETPKITKELMKKVFEIEEGKKIIQVAWLSSAVYEKGTGYVELEFSPRLKPYMIKLGTVFTQYKLANILSMKSKYSPRIYEILKCNEFKKQAYIEIEVLELRKLISADNVYPKYNDFKRYIIERTQKELKKISDISFEFEEVKTGRKVTSFKFYIHSNKANKSNNFSSFDEVSATLETETPLEILEKSIGEVMAVTEKSFTEKNASTFWGDSNGDIKLISKAYEYMKNQKVKTSKVGYMRTLIKNFDEPQKLEKVGVDYTGFNNFKPREYDYDSLEKKLLGWEE
jgi:plasmid replication initiation protein